MYNNKNYWCFPAKLDRVVDGDTVDITVDLGFRTYKNIRVRLENVDTAEIYGTGKSSEEYQKGMRQKEFVEDLLDVDGEWPLHFESNEETGKYGRWIGEIIVDDMKVTEELIMEWPDVLYE